MVILTISIYAVCHAQLMMAIKNRSVFPIHTQTQTQPIPKKPKMWLTMIIPLFWIPSPLSPLSLLSPLSPLSPVSPNIITHIASAILIIAILLRCLPSSCYGLRLDFFVS